MYSDVRNRWCVLMIVTLMCITAAAAAGSHQQRRVNYNEGDGEDDRRVLSLRKEALVSCSDAILQELYTITDQLVDIKKHRMALPPRPLPVVHDCSTLYDEGVKGSGVYQVFPFTFQVYCDMVNHGGGWTVIQRRLPQEPQENFARDWSSYRDGFGQLRGEMWLGLEAMHQLTYSADYELMVEMIDYEQGPKHAHFEVFQVGPEEDGYRLLVANYSGDAGDALTIFHNGRRFSTYDRDQDTADHKSCAVDKEGGWWFQACYAAHPNGRIPDTLSRTNSRDIRWWKSYEEVLVLTHIEMKIRRRPTTSQSKVTREKEEGRRDTQEEKDDEQQHSTHKNDDEDIDYAYPTYPTSDKSVYPTYPTYSSSDKSVHPTYPYPTSDNNAYPTYPTSDKSVYPTYPTYAYPTSDNNAYPTYPTSDKSVYPTYPTYPYPTSDNNAYPTYPTSDKSVYPTYGYPTSDNDAYPTYPRWDNNAYPTYPTWEIEIP